MRHESLRAALAAMIQMPAQFRRAASQDRPQDPPVMRGQAMVVGEGRQADAHDVSHREAGLGGRNGRLRPHERAASGGLLEYAQIDGFERSLQLGDYLTAHVQIARGGAEIAMADHALDHGQRDSRLQKVRGEAVAKGMNASIVRQSGMARCHVENPLRGRLVQRAARNRWGGKEPAARLARAAGGPESMGRERASRAADSAASTLAAAEAALVRAMCNAPCAPCRFAQGSARVRLRYLPAADDKLRQLANLRHTSSSGGFDVCN